jgi:L-Ala-D/L-Glu epimerase / N-acetyl-D-glutamate racemase
MPTIAALSAEPLDVALTEPFGIASGTQPAAHNVLCTLKLRDGTTGLGEAAPFPAVSGETQSQTLATLETAKTVLLGEDARRWRRIARSLRELAPEAPAARAAVEMALLDALCRRSKLSLWSFFGGAERELMTDITIVTGDVEHARSSAERAARDGFETLKIKVGAGTHDLDVARLVAIAEAAPSARLILDANASLDAEQAIELVRALGKVRRRVALFEQPTAADDLDGMRRVREGARVRVAADESAKSACAVAELTRARAADVVNVKLMKSGIAEALELAAAARAMGLGLMVGGMVETRLAMSAGACFAAGLGGFSHVDLDTPLFMKDSPFTGGYTEVGPRRGLADIVAGHGVSRA